ncbi:hypothetical protein BT93_L5777 [Corymbia citriodora subsp. variegata]|uniref:Protein N-terminal and lysine N-methyltransferase EFM7 n=1 Tax=Corymbia citriodora subsp. variegata TaxID=360336 RepID=A0A8T0CF15_CORYI|nr:hypothetical protein BT93_L5777 [Corymbia citriodora subsp. variegata]
MEYSSSPEDSGIELFKEPKDYYAPEKPATFVHYTTQNGEVFNLRLVGHSPLWGHLLWNAGQVVAKYVEVNSVELVQGKSVLELGAGAGLPSLVCALYGAKVVVVTDYPENDLISNLRHNIETASDAVPKTNIEAEGFLWGNPTDVLMTDERGTKDGFDLLILADILFNHSEHEKLLSTVRSTLKNNQDASALVFFTPYRPWLLEKDLHFFEIAKSAGMVVNKLFEHVMDKVMFPEDPGDEVLRRTVFAYEVKWPRY